MIFGIGTDICDIRRMQAIVVRRGVGFARRVLGASEMVVFGERYAHAPTRGIAYLASRFSAKEAFAKALGLGMRWPMGLRACEILNGAQGQPTLVLHGELAAWFDARQLRGHVTLSDEADYAVSFVVIEHRGS
jgi:holo-[acyl-carrier protein] synthase